MITQAELKERLHYDPVIGLFWWKPKPETDRFARIWNSRRAGHIAGSLTSKGYVRISLNDVKVLAHRLAWLYVTGDLPEEIDHKNRRRDDNAFENLRLATRSQNLSNRSFAMSD